MSRVPRAKIKKNGKKRSGKQNYCCNSCYRQFIDNHQLTYRGCKNTINRETEKVLVSNCSIRDIAEIKNISIGRILSAPTKSRKIIQPKQKHYDRLEVNEFWIYVGSENHKVWIIYAYRRKTEEIETWVWEKRDTKTAKRLKKEMDRLELSYNNFCTDGWSSFIKNFGEEKHLVRKTIPKE